MEERRKPGGGAEMRRGEKWVRRRRGEKRTEGRRRGRGEEERKSEGEN